MEEANRMLRKITKDGEDSKETKIGQLQKQLDELKSIKVLRLARLQEGGTRGLLDSGATHPLRGRREGEKMRGYREVTVSLAGGKEAMLHVTKEGVMVAKNPRTEPIVPMGMVVDLLGCRVSWDEEDVSVTHPKKGRLEVVLRGGCPEISKEDALMLIEEIEEKVRSIRPKDHDEQEEQQAKQEELEWLHRILQEHPAFRNIPEDLRNKILEPPAEDVAVCGNRRQRRKWAKEGLILHLYAGEDEGYTFKRAFHEVGGDKNLVLEVDCLRDPKWDMLPGGKAFPALLRMALNGWLKMVLGGPNCRTRSVLRHRPLGEKEWGPRPLRSWQEGQEWGGKDLTEKERQKVQEDDILMLRMIMLFVIAEEIRKANGARAPTHFAVEKPAVPKEDEVVSWWKTDVWKMLKKIYGFKESTFDQWNWGGKAHKPTTVGGTIEVEAPPRLPGGKKRETEGKTAEELLKESRQLARWAPGMMRALAEQVVEKIFNKQPKMRPLSWDEHVRANHTPFRRDCRICQEAMAKASPHRKAGHARAGVLSLDLSGPFKKAKDIAKGTFAKFLLVGVYTWIDPRPGGHPAPDEEVVDVPDDAPDFDEEEKELEPGKKPRGRPRKDDMAMRQEEEERLKWKEDQQEAEEAQKPKRGEPIEGGIFNDTESEEEAARVPAEEEEDRAAREPAQEDAERVREPEAAEERAPEEQPKPEDGEEEEDDGSGVKIRYCRMVLPIATKLAEDIVRAVQLFYLRLRSKGFVVSQIHTDRGGEFDNVNSRNGGKPGRF